MIDWPTSLAMIGLFAIAGGATIAIVAINHTFRTKKAEQDVELNNDYRKIAEEAIDTQAAILAELSTLKTELRSLHAQVTEIDRVLKEVE